MVWGGNNKKDNARWIQRIEENLYMFTLAKYTPGKFWWMYRAPKRKHDLKSKWSEKKKLPQ